MPRLTALVALSLIAAGCSSGDRSQPHAKHVARIAFAKGQRIGVADANGRHWRFVARGVAPLISPDGHWIAFSGAKGLAVVNADGGETRRLARDGYPTVWAPDSRHLAAVVGPTATPPYDVHLVTVDRTHDRGRLIARAQYFDGCDFSPDSSRLAFAMSRRDEHTDIYVARTDGGALRRLTRDDRSSWPLWTSDGSISFSRREGPVGGGAARNPYWGTHRLWLMAATGARKTVMTKQLPTLTTARLGLKGVAWSRSGRVLLAVSPTHGGDYVYVVDRRGSVRSLGNRGYFGYARALNISRDGRLILLWNQLDGPDSRRTRVEAVPTNGSRPRVLARDVGPPSWSR